MGYIQEPQSQPLLKHGVPQESRWGEGEVGRPQAPVFGAPTSPGRVGAAAAGVWSQRDPARESPLLELRKVCESIVNHSHY